MANGKVADLPCGYNYTSEWNQLRLLYEQRFSKRSDDTNWIFRAETRPQLSNHKTRDKSKDCPIAKANYFQTSFEEAYDRFKPQEVEKDKRYTRRELEMVLIREFQRKAHQHLRYCPEPENTIEWLTLMQHYEGPTRLLDWSYSFYVALFFALARLDCTKEYAEVWALNSRWIGKAEDRICKTVKLKKLSHDRRKDPINMDRYHNAILDRLFKSPQPLVLVLNAFRLYDRLIAQQGTFLVQGDIDQSFDDNLKGMGRKSGLQNNLHRIAVDVKLSKRNQILKELNRMNINSAALFPGLQGFAESLATQLADPGKFGIEKR